MTSSEIIAGSAGAGVSAASAAASAGVVSAASAASTFGCTGLYSACQDFGVAQKWIPGYPKRNKKSIRNMQENYKNHWNFRYIQRQQVHHCFCQQIDTQFEKHTKTRETNKPECSDVKHTCGTNYFNTLVHCSPVALPVKAVEWGGVHSVACADCEECGVLSVECGLYCVESGVLSVECGVLSVELRV